jgi:hypothetical protein
LVYFRGMGSLSQVSRSIGQSVLRITDDREIGFVV